MTVTLLDIKAQCDDGNRSEHTVQNMANGGCRLRNCVFSALWASVTVFPLRPGYRERQQAAGDKAPVTLLVARWSCPCACVRACAHTQKGSLPRLSQLCAAVCEPEAPGATTAEGSSSTVFEKQQQTVEDKEGLCASWQFYAYRRRSPNTVEAWWSDTGKANIMWWGPPTTTGHSQHFPLYILWEFSWARSNNCTHFSSKPDPGNWSLLDITV